MRPVRAAPESEKVQMANDILRQQCDDACIQSQDNCFWDFGDKTITESENAQLDINTELNTQIEKDQQAPEVISQSHSPSQQGIPAVCEDILQFTNMAAQFVDEIQKLRADNAILKKENGDLQRRLALFSQDQQ